MQVVLLNEFDGGHGIFIPRHLHRPGMFLVQRECCNDAPGGGGQQQRGKHFLPGRTTAEFNQPAEVILGTVPAHWRGAAGQMPARRCKTMACYGWNAMPEPPGRQPWPFPRVAIVFATGQWRRRQKRRKRKKPRGSSRTVSVPFADLRPQPQHAADQPADQLKAVGIGQHRQPGQNGGEPEPQNGLTRRAFFEAWTDEIRRKLLREILSRGRARCCDEQKQSRQHAAMRVDPNGEERG